MGRRLNPPGTQGCPGCPPERARSYNDDRVASDLAMTLSKFSYRPGHRPRQKGRLGTDRDRAVALRLVTSVAFDRQPAAGDDHHGVGLGQRAVRVEGGIEEILNGHPVGPAGRPGRSARPVGPAGRLGRSARPVDHDSVGQGTPGDCPGNATRGAENTSPGFTGLA